MSEEEVEEPLLKLEGMTPELARIFKEQGYYTVESLAIEAPHILLERIGERKDFNLDKARRFIKQARSRLKIQIMKADELLEEEKKKQCISTGSKKLDEILGGGIRTGEITEVIGEYGVGKTTMVYTIALGTIKDLKAESLIFDTEATFSPKRLYEIAKARGFNPEETLPQVNYAKIYGTEHLIFMLENAHKIIKERNIRLIAVDSLLGPFRAEYLGREMLAPRQQKIGRCLRTLLNYARVYNMAVLVTNQVLATPVATYTYERPEMINVPTGGHVVAHTCNNRLYIRKGAEAIRIATLIDSSYLPRREATFRIAEAGVIDTE